MKPWEIICIIAPSPHPWALKIKKSQGDESHMRNRRIGDEFFHVLLHQRNQGDVDHGNQRQRNHQPGQFMAGVRGDRQAEADKAVTAHFQHDGSQDNRAAGGRLHMGIR